VRRGAVAVKKTCLLVHVFHNKVSGLGLREKPAFIMGVLERLQL
jgi:hypothetical protein